MTANQTNYRKAIISIPHLTVMTIPLLGLSLLQSGCMQQDIKQDPYKEGDIVTWKINDHLILKAEVGERREHVVTRTPQGEAEFYRPQYERYLGQFSIDYQPIGFDKINEVEARDMPISKASRGYEFNLMLNGSWVQATDEIVESSYALDHPDQVKVVIKNADVREDTQRFFDNQLVPELDTNSAETNKGVTCYGFEGEKGKYDHQRCFGESLSPLVSGFEVYIPITKQAPIYVQSRELIYNGIKITWVANRKNLDQAQAIDSAIWRLLDTWNISPLNAI